MATEIAKWAVRMRDIAVLLPSWGSGLRAPGSRLQAPSSRPQAPSPKPQAPSHYYCVATGTVVAGSGQLPSYGGQFGTASAGGG